MSITDWFRLALLMAVMSGPEFLELLIANIPASIRPSCLLIPMNVALFVLTPLVVWLKKR